MSLKRMYISGKITGLYLPDAKKNFDEAEKTVRKHGYTPVNPMSEVPKQVGFEWLDYMKVDIKLLMDCDEIFMLTNWKDSKGAIIEHDIAKKLGYKIIYQEKTNNMGNLIKKVDIKRVGDNGETSIGVIYLDGIAKCGSIEDQEQKGEKIKHETRVSNGVYKLALRKEGSFHQKYSKKYAKKGKDWHQGMLCVYTDKNWVLNCPDGKSFQYILWHLGNTEKNTSGCLLPNYVIDFLNDRGSRSGDAYEDIYPIIRDSILASDKVDEWGNKYIEIEYSDVEDGK